MAQHMGAVDDMGAVDGTRAIHIYLRMYTHTCISISLYVYMYTHTHLLGRSIRARSIATSASLAGCCNTASAGSGGLVCCSVLQYVAICWEQVTVCCNTASSKSGGLVCRSVLQCVIVRCSMLQCVVSGPRLGLGA